MKHDTVPLLFIVFNRPDLTKIVFEKIRSYRPKKLYVAADGARTDNVLDETNCSEVRQIIETVDWPCDVATLFRSENYGCKKAVSEAITWFFDQEEFGIILEDDVYPDDTFFRFCENLLWKYRDDNRISMISGDNFSFGHLKSRDSYYYSLYSHIWGWASWKRAWSNYDVKMQSYPERKSELVNDKRFSPLETEFWMNIFDAVYNGQIDTWDYQWMYANFIAKRVSIMPTVNLVSNIGFREDATHTKGSVSRYANMRTEGLSFPLVHPAKFRINYEADQFSRDSFLPSRPTEDSSKVKKILRRMLMLNG